MDIQNTDEQLILSWKMGNEKAFEEFYQLHFKKLLILTIKRVHSLEDAEEIIQDAFLSLYKKKDSLNGAAIAYLKATIRNLVFNYYAHSTKEKLLYSNLVLNKDNLPTQNNILDKIAEKEISAKIDNSINLLPSQCRNVFQMSRKRELSNKDIAQRLNISVKAVEGHITRALKHLRSQLDYFIWIFIFYLLWLPH